MRARTATKDDEGHKDEGVRADLCGVGPCVRARASADQHGGGHDGGPQPLLVADGGLRDVLRADDLRSTAGRLLSFRPSSCRDRTRGRASWPAFRRRAPRRSRRRCPRSRRSCGARRGSRTASRSRGMATPTVAAISRCGSRVAASDMTTKVTCPGSSRFMPWRARQNPAVRRKDARHAHEVAGGDAGGAQRQLERGQLLAVLADTLGEEHLLGDESDHVTLLVARGKLHGKHRYPTVSRNRRRARGNPRPIDRRLTVHDNLALLTISSLIE